MTRHCPHCFCSMEHGNQIYDVCPQCGWVEGTPPKDEYHLWPRTVLQGGRYMIGTVISFGGFGITYKAWDLQLEQVVAIKEYYPAGLVNRIPKTSEVLVLPGEKENAYFHGIKRFLEEARNMAKFVNMPYIVDVYNFFEENNTAYIVMEYLDGVDLKQYVQIAGGKISFEDALKILEPIMIALDEMHRKKLLHRDVSPDNIFITVDQHIKLIDFGAARLSREDEEATLSIIVKPGYTPPEQYRGKSRQGAYTDIYALGATLYWCITGEKPEESIDRKISDDLKSPKKLGVKLPDYADRAIMKSLALKAGLRFNKISEFRLALNNKKQVDYPEIEYMKKKRLSIAIVALSCLVLVTTSFAVWGYQQKYNVTISPAHLTMWVPVESEEEGAFQALKNITDEFSSSNAGMVVSLVPVKEEEYNQKLLEAAENGEMPDLFRGDIPGEDISQLCIKLDYLEHTLDKSQYWFLEDYKTYFPSEQMMPTGFDLPAVYWNINQVSIEETDVPMRYETLMEQEETVGISTWVLPELRASGLSYTVQDGTAVLEEGAEEAIIRFAQEVRLHKTTGEEDFLTGQESIYIGSSMDYSSIRSGLGGQYGICLLEPDEIRGRFVNCWSVSTKSEKNSQYAAMKLIDFLLGEYMQNLYYVQNYDALPLNRISLAQYQETYEEWQTEESYFQEHYMMGEEG